MTKKQNDEQNEKAQEEQKALEQEREQEQEQQREDAGAPPEDRRLETDKEAAPTPFEAANQWTPEQNPETPEEEPFNPGGKDIQYLQSEASDADVEAADIRLTQGEIDQGNTIGQTTDKDDDKDSGVHA